MLFRLPRPLYDLYIYITYTVFMYYLYHTCMVFIYVYIDIKYHLYIIILWYMIIFIPFLLTEIHSLKFFFRQDLVVYYRGTKDLFVRSSVEGCWPGCWERMWSCQWGESKPENLGGEAGLTGNQLAKPGNPISSSLKTSLFKLREDLASTLKKKKNIVFIRFNVSGIIHYFVCGFVHLA